MDFIINRLNTSSPLARQAIKFGVTGTIGAIIDFSTYTILTRVLNWERVVSFFGFEVIAANMVSVLLAILGNFLLNKYWTFRDNNEQVLQQGLTYFGFNTVTWVLNQILTSVFVFRVAWLGTLFGDQRDFVAKALAIGVIMFVNFLGSKFLIFRKTNLTPNQIT